MSFSSFAKASFLIEIAFGSDGGRTDCSELVQNLISGTASDVDAVASIFKSIVVDMTRREPENDDKFGALASNVQQFWNMLLASPSTQMSFLIGEKFIEAQVLALMELCTSDHDEEDLLERCSLYERLGSLGILLQLSVLGLRDAARLAVGPLQGAVFQVETSTLRLLGESAQRRSEKTVWKQNRKHAETIVRLIQFANLYPSCSPCMRQGCPFPPLDCEVPLHSGRIASRVS